MNEEIFNMSIRKFLKGVGIRSQQEIEQTIRKALADGKIGAKENIPAVMTLKIDKLNLIVNFNGEISLE